MWCICGVRTGYKCTFEVYCGKNTALNRTTYATVMRLLTQARLLDFGHHIGFDNFFSSPTLFLDLFTLNITATGTVRSSRSGLPPGIQTQPLLNQEVAEWRRGNLLCVKYRDGSQQPILLSTACMAGYKVVRNKEQQLVERPNIVTDHNNVMEGVELNDHKLYAYLNERRTLKWTTKMTFYMPGVTMLNSYIVYKMNTRGKAMTHLDFMSSIVTDLAGKYVPKTSPVKRRMREQVVVRRRAPLRAIILLVTTPPSLSHHHKTITKKTETVCSRSCMPGQDKLCLQGMQCWPVHYLVQ